MPATRQKSAHVKREEGNRGHRPIVDGLAVKSSVPKIPKELTGDAVIEWKRVTKELDSVGLITNLDLAVLSLYCAAYGRFLAIERTISSVDVDEMLAGKGSTYENLLHQSFKMSEHLRKLSTELGLSPAARVRVQPAKKEENESGSAQFFDA